MQTQQDMLRACGILSEDRRTRTYYVIALLSRDGNRVSYYSCTLAGHTSRIKQARRFLSERVARAVAVVLQEAFRREGWTEWCVQKVGE